MRAPEDDVERRDEMNDREQLRQRFNRAFARWEIELPDAAMSPEKVTLIVKRGWTIWTRFDIDPEDGQEYLDVYSMHRMTNDSHVRCFANGEEERLPAIGWSYGIPSDATEAVKEALQAKFFADNQAVEKLLEEKGFVMTDKAHPSAQVDRYFRTCPDAGDEC